MCVAWVMAGQYLMFDQDITWEGGTGAAYQTFSAPLNWSQGLMYRRYEIKSKPTSLKMGIEQCVWSGGETCSSCEPFFTEPGTYYIADNPGSWWKQAGALSGWDVHGNRAFIIADGGCGNWIATCTNPWCHGPEVAGDLPVATHITEYYVDPGTDFECPAGWEGAPDSWNCPTTEVVAQPKGQRAAEGGIQVESVSPHRLDLRLSGSGRVSVYSPNGDRLATAIAGVSGRVSLDGLSIAPGVLLVKTEGNHTGAVRVLMP
jgi:hypothetical protein